MSLKLVELDERWSSYTFVWSTLLGKTSERKLRISSASSIYGQDYVAVIVANISLAASRDSVYVRGRSGTWWANVNSRIPVFGARNGENCPLAFLESTYQRWLSDLLLTSDETDV